MAVDILPCLGSNERDFVWTKADHLAVFLVKGLHVDIQLASDKGDIAKDG